MIRQLACHFVVGITFALMASRGHAADWPMWRNDAARSAASAEQLPDTLHLLWTRRFSPRQPAWDDPLNRDLMTYDRVLEPVVKDGRLFVGFNDRDKLAAFDIKTGAELWSHFTEGPVRLPAVAWKNSVFFTSDDGHLYRVNATDGTLEWKFRGGPSGRMALGNRRLISAWPSRGGVVLRDDKVYFATSIWPFMGVFIYALDAESGDVVWVNDETGSQYMRQPHGAPSFAGVAPQGALVATQDVLMVPGGRSVPAAFDRHTGKFLYFEINAGGKGTGGSFVAANEESFFVHTRLKGTREFALKTGVKTAFLPNEPVLAGARIYSAEMANDQPVVRAYDRETKAVVWEVPADGRGDLILAGDRLYAASGRTEAEATTVTDEQRESHITVIRLPQADELPKAERTLSPTGDIERLIAANGQLFAVTRGGTLHAFGAHAAESSVEFTETVVPLPMDAAKTSRVDGLLESEAAEGYALWLGAADQPLVEALAARSNFAELLVVDEDSARVSALRRRLDAAGLYGKVTVRHSGFAEFQPPPYVANQVFVGREWTTAIIEGAGQLARLYESVRPYGGVMHLLAEADEIPRLVHQITALKLERAEVTAGPHGVIVRRVGALPGAGTWTHQHGDVANTIKSNDQRVKLPLGILWYGGNSHDDILPRHGHGPPEQVMGGRLFIQGMNLLTARDVYTGRTLWQREFKDLGTYDVYFDETYAETPLNPAYNQVHIPGANARGTNYVVTPDRVYLLEGAVCHVLDAATGASLPDIALPQADPNQPHEWGFLGVYDDVLLGGLGFAKYRTRLQLEAEADAGLSRNRAGFGSKSLDRAASMALVAFDRHTGALLWKVDAKQSFWHNGIVAGNGLVYALDKNPKPVEDFLKRRGKANPETYRIVALDVRTGKPAWEISQGIFGTWLGYSPKHDMLLQAGAAGSDRLSAEVGQGIAVYHAKDGSLAWKKDDLNYAGPCVLHNDWIITNANSYSESAGAYALLDGTQKMEINPLTGKPQPWRIVRSYGCTGILASENMLTFRSGAAGYYDLLTEGGTGNFGGFRSGCTANLVVADGVLNAPDYTRTCSCAYQNQTSLALVHMPDLDVWTVSNAAVLEPSSGRVKHLGMNLGAPGDRRDPEGLMWLEYPPQAGDSPNLGLEFSGNAQFYQGHPTTMTGTPAPWVMASGVRGLSALRMSLKALPRHTLATGLPIEHADDDAEEAPSGAVSLDSSALELIHSTEDQVIGLRFSNLPLARNASVRSAALQFVCRLATDVPTELSIAAEMTGNAARFTDKSGDITNRKLTTARVRWTPPAWNKDGDAGAAQQTPDLSPLIREVLAHPDWQPGNSVAFVITGTGKRVAAACRGRDNSFAAKLKVDADEVSLAGNESSSPQPYRLRLYFGAPRELGQTKRVFDVAVNGQTVVKDVTLGGGDHSAPAAEIRTIERILLGDQLELQFKSQLGEPLLSGVELLRLEN